MENTVKASKTTGLEIAVAALAIGVAGDSLLRSEPWGLNVPIMAVLGVAAIIVLRYRSGARAFSVREYALLGASLFFASWFAIRDSEPLLFLNVLAILLIGALLFLPTLKLPIKGSGIVHYIISGIAIGLSAVFMPVVLLAKDLKWDDLLKDGASKKALLVVRGALIATPLVLVFGALFAAADAAFEGFVTNTFQVVPEELALHAFFTAFFAWPAAGYLRAVTLGVSLDNTSADEGSEPEPEKRDFADGNVESVTAATDGESPENAEFGTRHIPSITTSETLDPEKAEEGDAERKETDEKKIKREWDFLNLNNSMLPEFLTVGSVEVGVVLGSLNLLFFSFVLLQLPYLFGGMELVQDQPGLKLAEYARRGFGELFAASMLVLPMLMVLHWLVRRNASRALNLFRYLAAIQIGLLFVIMMSAFQRMLLYTGELGYGMTAGRFFPMAFMIWLAVVFLLFGYTVLRGQRSKFAWNAAVSALVMVAVLNFVNPDDFIVRTNLDLKQQGRPFDAKYNASLSDDAVPALANGISELTDIQQNAVMETLVWRQCFNPLINDIRVWNYSRSRAAAAEPSREFIENVGCQEFLDQRRHSRDRFLGEY